MLASWLYLFDEMTDSESKLMNDSESKLMNDSESKLVKKLILWLCCPTSLFCEDFNL